MATTKKTTEDGAVVEAKPKKKPRGGNSPVIGDNGLMAEPGDNAKYVMLGMKLFNLPSIDLHDPMQVNDRLNEFFQIHAEADMKPTVSGMGMALGLDRRRLCRSPGPTTCSAFCESCLLLFIANMEGSVSPEWMFSNSEVFTCLILNLIRFF